MYKMACTDGTKKVKRARLNLIGEYRTGKTSFLEALLGNDFNPESPSTEGIAIHFIKIKDEIWNKTILNSKEALNEFSKQVMEMSKTQSDNPQSEENSPLMKQSEEKIVHDNATKNDTKSQTNSTQQENTNAVSMSAIPIIPDNYPPHEPKAEDIQDLQEVKPKFDDETLMALREVQEDTEDVEERHRILAWDFGGQTAYYVTHHLFLDTRATNLIVMDISKGLPSSVARETQGPLPSIPVEFLFYWLNSIYIAASKNSAQPNVALILTHADMIEASDKSTYIERYKNDILHLTQGKPYSMYLSGDNIFVVDNKSRSEEEFNKVRREIFKMLEKQKSWGMERPVRWLKLEADIRKQMEEEGKQENGSQWKQPYMSLDTVESLALVYGMDDKEVQAFLQFHHITGDLVYFSEDNLKDRVIVDPQWLVDMFQTFITPQDFINRKHLTDKIKKELKDAEVSESSLQVLWGLKDVDFLIELMIKFALIISLDLANQEFGKKERWFLIPSMVSSEKSLKKPRTVSDNRADLPITLDASHELRVGESLPLGEFSRFVARCSRITDWVIHRISNVTASFEIAKCVLLFLALENHFTVYASMKCEADIKSIKMELYLEIKKTLAANMKGFNMKASVSFDLLCPSCKLEGADLFMIEVKQKEDPHSGQTCYHIQEECRNHHKFYESSWLPEVEFGILLPIVLS